MEEGLVKNARLMKEYEDTFDNEERVVHALDLTENKFKLDTGVISFTDIGFSEPLKKARKETYLGLTKSVGEL